MSSRPDRLALWAVLLGLVMIAIAAGTAHGQTPHHKAAPAAHGQTPHHAAPAAHVAHVR
jgi:hypothetical protein